MTTEQNDFFAVTTSDFGESASEEENEESVNLAKRPILKDSIPKIQKPVPKPVKIHNNYNISERFLYHPQIDFSNLSKYVNTEIEVRVENCYLSPSNPNVKAAHLFGTDYYTSTSDFVAIFLHSKAFSSEELKRKQFAGISLTFSVTKQKRNYGSSERNGIVSKKLNVSNSVNFQTVRLEQYRLLTVWKLEEVYRIAENATMLEKKRTKIIAERKEIRTQPRFNNLVFNMNNELAIEYNLINVCEKGNDSRDFLSNLLKKYFMVIETNRFTKYVITATQKDQLRYFPNEFMYKLMMIKNAFEFDNEHFHKHKFGGKKNFVEVVKGIAWEDIVWSEHWIRFKGANFEIVDPASYKFYKIIEA